MSLGLYRRFQAEWDKHVTAAVEAGDVALLDRLRNVEAGGDERVLWYMAMMAGTYHSDQVNGFHKAGEGGSSCPSCSPAKSLERLITKFVDDVYRLTGDDPPQVTIKLPRPYFYGFLAGDPSGRMDDTRNATGCTMSVGYTTVRIEPLP